MPCTEERHTYSILLTHIWSSAVPYRCWLCHQQMAILLIPYSFHMLGMSYQTDLSIQRRQSILHVPFKPQHVLVRRSCVFKGTVCLRFCLFALGKWGKCLLISKAVLSGADRVCCRFSCVSGTLYLLQLLLTFPLQEVSALVEQFCVCILEITLGRIILFKQPLPILLEVT